MKKIFRKALSTILAVFIIISMCPLTAVTAFAETAYTSEDGNYKYSVLYTDGEKTYIQINKCLINTETVEIPQKIDGNIVKGIYSAFSIYSNANVRNIVIPEGVEYIDSSAFRDMQNISVSLPSSLIFIGKSVFQGASISALNFPENLLAIDDYAFYTAVFNNTDIILPESLKYLGDLSFCESNIENIKMGKNVKPAQITYNYSGDINASDIDFSDATQFKWNAFFDCSNLDSIEIDKDNQNLIMQGDMLLTKDLSYLIYILPHNGNPYETLETPRSISSLNNSAFDKELTVNNLLITNNIKSLDDFCFENTCINNITFESGCQITKIPMGAFSCSQISDIVIPASVETINGFAFEGSSITSLSFETPSSCTNIGESAFMNCTKLKSIFLPNSLIKMGYIKDTGYNANHQIAQSKVFYNCTSLETITFEDNSKLKHWESSNFANCPNIKEINTGKNNAVEQIYCGFGAISTCNNLLETLDFSNCPNLYYFGDEFAFYNALKEVNLSGTKISSLNGSTFYSCPSLETVILPDSLETLNSKDFAKCVNLANINLDNVIDIADDTFEGCNSLNGIDTTRTKGELNGFKYYEMSNCIVIYDYEGDETNIVIPDYISNKPVTKIRSESFKNTAIDALSLPASLEYIGEYAFQNCNITSQIIFPQDLTYIGAGAFAGNRITGALSVPDGITAIYDDTFNSACVNEFNIGRSVTSIGHNAINGVFESLIIPDSVTTIDFDFICTSNLKSIYFGKNSLGIENIINYRKKDSYEVNSLFENLEIIEVSQENPNYSAQDNVLYNKNKTKLLLCVRKNNAERLIIPCTVVSVESFAFTKASADSVIFSNGLERIEENAFYGSAIFNVYIPGSLNYMGWWAFQKSRNLKSVEFGDGISLENLYYTFSYCSSLESVIFSINAKINSLTYSFEETAIKSIEIPQSVTYMEGTFYHAKLEKITLPESLEYIGINTFNSSQISSIVIPEKVIAIGNLAFYNCNKLAYVNLGNVNSLNSYCFQKCTALEKIDLTGVTYISQTAFDGCDNLKKLYFTQEEKDAYIAENEFKGNETVETVVIGNSINQIQDGAFADCTNLETAVISSSVTSIADDAFDNCNSLTIICLENSYVQSYAQLKSIPYQTFRIAPIADCEYTGQEITPEITVSIGESILTDGKEYTALYKNNIKVGTATVTACGLGDYSIFNCLAKFSIVPGPNGEGLENENEQNGKDESSANKQGNSPQNSGNAQGSSSSTPQSNTAGAVKQSGTGSTAKAESTQAVSGTSSDNAQEKSIDEAASKADGADTQTAENAEENGASGGAQSNKEKEKQSLWEKIVSFFASLFAFIIGKLRELFS